MHCLVVAKSKGGNKMKEKIEIAHKQIHDYSMRLRTIAEIGNSIGLSKDETTILMFAVMGDLDKDYKLSEILKKVKLPQVNAKYNTEKLKKYIKYLNRQLKSIANDYGILDLEKGEVLRKSRNGEYITAFGLQVTPYTLQRMIKLLDRAPDYAISTMLGIYEALGKILKFLDVEKEDDKK